MHFHVYGNQYMDDVYIEITSFLSIRELGSLSCVSHYFVNICSQDAVWVGRILASHKHTYPKSTCMKRLACASIYQSHDPVYSHDRITKQIVYYKRRLCHYFYKLDLYNIKINVYNKERDHAWIIYNGHRKHVLPFYEYYEAIITNIDHTLEYMKTYYRLAKHVTHQIALWRKTRVRKDAFEPYLTQYWLYHE